MPYKTALGHIYDSGDFKNNLQDATTLANMNNFNERKKESFKKGFLRKENFIAFNQLFDEHYEFPTLLKHGLYQ